MIQNDTSSTQLQQQQRHASTGDGQCRILRSEVVQQQLYVMRASQLITVCAHEETCADLEEDRQPVRTRRCRCKCIHEDRISVDAMINEEPVAYDVGRPTSSAWIFL